MSVKKSTSTFRFRKAKGEDAPAIWFRLHGRDVMVYPLALYDALWGHCRNERFCYGIKADILICRDGKSTYCEFFDDDFGYYTIWYMQDTFIDSATRSLTDFCAAVIRGESTLYNKHEALEVDVKPQAAEDMLVGLQELATRVRYPRSVEDMKIERFAFGFTEPYNGDTTFVVRIGNRKFESYLSDWSNDFNRIRLDIESALWGYPNNSSIRLHYEDDPITIELIHYGLNNSDIPVFAVAVSPDYFHPGPKIFGFCEARQLISALYLGLLGICIAEVDDSFDECYGKWDDLRLEIYNHLQSCVIEDYIKHNEEEEDGFRLRNRVINTVAEMKADYQRLQEELAM